MESFISLKPGRDRAVLLRHPWIYSGAIKGSSAEIKNGDIVAVKNAGGQLLAYGHYSTQGSIRCRIFHFCAEAVSIDEAFWTHKFQQALAYRRSLGLLDSKAGNAFRLIFSEGDGVPGLVCDLFDDVAVLQLRTEGMRSLTPLISNFLQRELSVNHIFSREEKRSSNDWLLGEKAEVAFSEYNTQLIADVVNGQKTGFFLDQRDNRLLLQRYAAGRTVLNAFSYSGGFSAHALKGGAQHVVSVDISHEAIELCNRTMTLNGAHPSQHDGISADCFDYLREMPSDSFDLIVLDPPAFAKNEAAVNKATRGYKDINLQALQRIKSGGLLFTFSCSHHISRELFRKVVFGACADAKREVRVVHELSQPADHPISIYHPEGEYLKGLVLYVT